MFKPVTLKRVRYLLILTLLMSLAVSLTPSVTYAGANKATVCHKPGTPAEKTLEVSQSAVNAHLGHGDYTGACGPQLSAGCAAVNALVPDPQTDSNYYRFKVIDLTFLPGEVLHADITIQPLAYAGGQGALTDVMDSTGFPIAMDSHTNFDTGSLEPLTASITYVVVAGDDADGIGVGTVTTDDPFTLVSVHFSCTPAS